MIVNPEGESARNIDRLVQAKREIIDQIITLRAKAEGMQIAIDLLRQAKQVSARDA